jgi:flagellar biogenesis protein FliO
VQGHWEGLIVSAIIMWQQYLAVALVLGLLFAALGVLRRLGLANFASGLVRQAGKPRQMRVLERVALGTRHSLHLVALNGRLIVVGVSPDGCRRIAALSADALPVPLTAAGDSDTRRETASL